MKKAIVIFVLYLLTATAVLAEEKAKEKSLLGESGLEDVVGALTKPMDKVIGHMTKLGQIVITPTKTKETLGSQSSAVTVLEEIDFEKQKVDYVKSALKNEMGLDVVEASPFTGQASIFIRGANANHTLVMIDGMKIYDPISPNASYNFANLTLDNIERIEVVRGPQSALYGSDAMGGVINIITKRAKEPFFNFSVEGGSFDTIKFAGNAGAKTHGFDYSLGFSAVKSRGIPYAQAKNNMPETDPYERCVFSARLGYDLNENFSIGGTTRYTQTLFKYDSFRKDYDNLYQKAHEAIFTLYIDHKPLDFYSYYIKFGWMLNDRFDYDEGATYLRDWYAGYVFNFDYRNHFHIFDLDTFTLGYEYTEEMGDSYYQYTTWAPSDMPKSISKNDAFYIQNRFNYKGRLTATQGMRINRHKQAGIHTTYKFDGSYLFPTGTKIRAGWATGFKAPTLYQLNAVSNWWFGGGNPDLKPETSQSYEIGVDQYMFGERVLLHATYYHTMFKNLIDALYHPDTYYTDKYKNLSKAHAHGIELGGIFKPIKNVELRASYTYNYTKDYDTDTYMLRRPLHKFKINAFWEITPRLNLDTELKYVGIRLDVGSDKLKPYYVINGNLNYKLFKHLNFYVKVVNLFDQRYEEVRGYTTSPLAIYVGTKTEF